MDIQTNTRIKVMYTILIANRDGHEHLLIIFYVLEIKAYYQNIMKKRSVEAVKDLEKALDY